LGVLFVGGHWGPKKEQGEGLFISKQEKKPGFGRFEILQTFVVKARTSRTR
jgi:hypothetical protein